MQVSLDDIVRSYLVSQGKNTLHGYIRYMKHLVDFTRDFSLKHGYLDLVESLEMDNKNAVRFPASFVMLSDVAWASGDRLVRFQVDPSINTHFSYCGDAANATPNLSYNILLFEGGKWEEKGRGHNGIGYFTVNWGAKEIQFSSDVTATEVIVRYKSNGINPKSKSMLPGFAGKLAEDYIHWQTGIHKFGAASAEAMARKRNYMDSQHRMVANLGPLSIEDILGAMATGFDQHKLVH